MAVTKAIDRKRGEGSAGSRNTAQLRDAMPSRRTPGKTSASDPAAAPFDTDDEAAGTPAKQAAIDAELRRYDARLIARSGERRGAVGPLAIVVLIIALLTLAGMLFMLFSLSP